MPGEIIAALALVGVVACWATIAHIVQFRYHQAMHSSYPNWYSKVRFWNVFEVWRVGPDKVKKK